jgi:hypothetical protein
VKGFVVVLHGVPAARHQHEEIEPITRLAAAGGEQALGPEELVECGETGAGTFRLPFQHSEKGTLRSEKADSHGAIHDVVLPVVTQIQAAILELVGGRRVAVWLEVEARLARLGVGSDKSGMSGLEPRGAHR